jgi:hypothetical protein
MTVYIGCIHARRFTPFHTHMTGFYSFLPTTVHTGASAHDGLGRATLVRRFKRRLKPSHKASAEGCHPRQVSAGGAAAAPDQQGSRSERFCSRRCFLSVAARGSAQLWPNLVRLYGCRVFYTVMMQARGGFRRMDPYE